LSQDGRRSERHRNPPLYRYRGLHEAASAFGELYPELLADHRSLLRAAFDSHDGYEVDTEGDAFFVVFRSGKNGATAAAAAQRALAEHTWPDGNEVRVRMVCTPASHG